MGFGVGLGKGCVLGGVAVLSKELWERLDQIWVQVAVNQSRLDLF